MHSSALSKVAERALLREKIVAAASSRMIVIADASKFVDVLGAFPLPIEINRFGRAGDKAGDRAGGCGVGSVGGALTLRVTGGDAFVTEPFVTDGGHLILDASFGRIPDTRALSNALHAIPGVVEHGLFLNLAHTANIGRC